MSNLEIFLENYVENREPDLNYEERKPNKFWRDFNNIRLAVTELIKKLGHFPSSTEMRESRLPSLARAISLYHKGFEEVRKKLNLPNIFKKTKKMIEVEERVKEPIEIYLKKEYSDNRRSTADISEELNISWKSIGNWLEKLGIYKRTLSEHYLKWGVKKPSKKKLKKMYIDQRMSTVQIGKKIGVANVTVGNWLNQYNIPTRNISESRISKSARIPNKKELRKLYLEDRLSMNQIADIFGVTQGCIRDYCDRFNIKRRDNSESKLPKNFKPPTKKELKKLYYDQRMSLEKIGEIFGIAEPTIARLARRYGLEIRKNESKYNDYDFRKDLVDELLKISEKNPDQLTSWDFQRTKKDGRLVFAGVLVWYQRIYNCRTKEARNILVRDLYEINLEEDRLKLLLENYLGGENE